jgi:hypothetical protein
MALVPRGATEGDLVTMFSGIEVPYLLRKIPEPSTRQQFQFVGECYVHGIMDGEVLELEGEQDIVLI